MTNSNFVPLHVHSEYSLLDGACRIKELVAKAVELGMPALAITDHGNMSGTIQFYNECKKQGIKPIIGCEVYVAPSHRNRFYKQKTENERAYHHLVLLCKNAAGYKNLCKLVTYGYSEGFYNKPRIDKELLEKHHEGLVVLSACVAGEIPWFLINDRFADAEKEVQWYKNLFGDDYYIEVQNHGLESEKKSFPGLMALAKKYNIKAVATNDSHYINKTDAWWHEMLLCVGTKSTIDNPNHFKFENDEFYLKSEAEMLSIFPHNPDVVTNTAEVAEKCNFDFEFGNVKLPYYEIPKEYASHYDYLRDLTEKGIKKRYGDNVPESHIERMNYELNVINSMGFVSYYLIVWDFINWAKTQGIPVGPGRGSGAGSIVAYAIGITDIDPIRYNLFFERFLNPERVSMPDFDIDFCYDRRQEVVDYVTNKYGSSQVSKIITFGTIAAKNAVRDMGRVLGLDLSYVDKVAKMISDNPKTHLKDELKNAELKSLYENDPVATKLLDAAIAVEGMPRQISTHAAGVLIADKDITEYAPLLTNNGENVIQFNMTELELLGLVKMDFLGLRTLTVIDNAAKDIRKTVPDFSISNIPLDDKETFAMLSAGKTSGVFQFESAGMIDTLVNLQPTSIEDLTAIISLYRPGPMDSIPEYIKNKKNPSSIVYDDPKLKPILDVTYGILVYQEQVQQIFRDLAGFSLGRADIVRRAMGKKKIAIMEEEKKHFLYGMTDENGNVVIEGALKRGVNESVCNKLMDQMSAFASYAFNKSHAASYATVSYQTAYLKCHYPKEFMAALLSSYINDNNSKNKIEKYFNTCHNELHIEIDPPSVNNSDVKFTVKDGKIVFGLSALKNVGQNIMEILVSEREVNGEFKSFMDFVKRMKDSAINSRAYSALINAGAFDWTGYTRNTLAQGCDKYIDNVKSLYHDDQTSLYSYVDEDYLVPPMEILPEYEVLEKLNLEHEICSMYVSGNPLDEYSIAINALNPVSFLDIIPSEENPVNVDNKNASIIGIITAINKKISKKKTTYYLASITSTEGSASVFVYADTYAKYEKLLEEGKVAMFTIHISIDNDSTFYSLSSANELPINAKVTNNTSFKALAEKVKTPFYKKSTFKKTITGIEIKPAPEKKKVEPGLYIGISSPDYIGEMNAVLNICKTSPGNDVLYFVRDSKNPTKSYSNKNIKVAHSPDLVAKIEQIVGSGKIAYMK